MLSPCAKSSSRWKAKRIQDQKIKSQPKSRICSLKLFTWKFGTSLLNALKELCLKEWRAVKSLKLKLEILALETNKQTNEQPNKKQIKNKEEILTKIQLEGTRLWSISFIQQMRKP